MRRMQNSEVSLPEGYEASFVIDAASRKTGILLNLAALGIIAPLVAVFWLIIRPHDFWVRFSHLSTVLVFFLVLVLYILLHELVHGAAYKLLTGRKLTFGLTLSVAYCGVPDIFVYRNAALAALLAPFVVFTIVFLLAMLLVADPVSKFMFGFLLATHMGGCVGDLYDTGLYLFRFRDPTTLMQDTGPKQTFYTKIR